MEKSKNILFLFLLMLISHAAFVQVNGNGTVRDASEETLISTTVTEQGISNGTATEINGTYSLTVQKGAILVNI